MRYARAAFIGDVRLPFMLLIVLLAVFLSGWLSASYAHTQWLQEHEMRIRSEATRDSYRVLMKNLSRVRETHAENEAFIAVVEEIYDALYSVENGQE